MKTNKTRRSHFRIVNGKRVWIAPKNSSGHPIHLDKLSDEFIDEQFADVLTDEELAEAVALEEKKNDPFGDYAENEKSWTKFMRKKPAAKQRGPVVTGKRKIII